MKEYTRDVKGMMEFMPKEFKEMVDFASGCDCNMFVEFWVEGDTVKNKKLYSKDHVLKQINGASNNYCYIESLKSALEHYDDLRSRNDTSVVVLIYWSGPYNDDNISFNCISVKPQ